MRTVSCYARCCQKKLKLLHVDSFASQGTRTNMETGMTTAKTTAMAQERFILVDVDRFADDSDTETEPVTPESSVGGYSVDAIMAIADAGMALCSSSPAERTPPTFGLENAEEDSTLQQLHRGLRDILRQRTLHVERMRLDMIETLTAELKRLTSCIADFPDIARRNEVVMATAQKDHEARLERVHALTLKLVEGVAK